MRTQVYSDIVRSRRCYEITRLRFEGAEDLRLLAQPKNMPREHRYFVYILSSKSRRIYTGVTNDITRRVAQHKAGEIAGFTQHYKINRLVYFEVFQYIGNAIYREKEIKHWIRARRVALIERDNPTWDDLAADWGKPFELLKPVVGPGTADPPRQGREG